MPRCNFIGISFPKPHCGDDVSPCPWLRGVANQQGDASLVLLEPRTTYTATAESAITFTKHPSQGHSLRTPGSLYCESSKETKIELIAFFPF